MEGVPYPVKIMCIKKYTDLNEIFKQISHNDIICTDIAIPLSMENKKMVECLLFNCDDNILTLIKKYGVSKVLSCKKFIQSAKGKIIINKSQDMYLHNIDNEYIFDEELKEGLKYLISGERINGRSS